MFQVFQYGREEFTYVGVLRDLIQHCHQVGDLVIAEDFLLLDTLLE